MNRIGIIGGSGLYDMAGVTDLEDVRVDTPFGDPSDAIRVGRLDGHPVAFLPRHGRGHRLNPSEINYRANIWALKSLGVDFVLSVSAVGSMREEIEPGHLVFVDQFIDRTRGQRAHTFFDRGCVAHVSVADPTCGHLVNALAGVAADAGITHHKGGTYVCIEGPQFSTRAESRAYRAWDVSVIGMTNLTEAKLAREAELHYATIAMSTDYDVWHESEEDVSVEGVLAVLRGNVERAQTIIRGAADAIAALRERSLECICGRALQYAIITNPEVIPADARRRLDLFIGKYLDQGDAR